MPLIDGHSPADAKTNAMTRERGLMLLLVAATVVAIYFCYRLAEPFLPALAWALALAVIVHPWHRQICLRVRNDNIAAGISLAIVVVLLVGPSLFVMHNLISQATRGADRIGQAAVGGRLQEAIERHPQMAPVISWIQQNIDVQGETQRLFESFASGATSLVTGSVLAIVQLLFTLFALFFFLRDSRQALFSTRALLPLSDTETDRMYERVGDTIYGTIYGTLTVAMLQGALGGLMFWFLGLPAPLLWAVVMGLLAIVPYLGAFVVWGPAAIYLAAQGEVGKAVTLTLWGMIVVGLVDNLVYPLLVGKRIRMHPLLALVAIIGGLSVFGSSGLVLGPVVVAISQGLVHVWQTRTAGQRSAEHGVDEDKLQPPPPRSAVRA